MFSKLILFSSHIVLFRFTDANILIMQSNPISNQLIIIIIFCHNYEFSLLYLCLHVEQLLTHHISLIKYKLLITTPKKRKLRCLKRKPHEESSCIAANKSHVEMTLKTFDSASMHLLPYDSAAMGIQAWCT